MRFPKNFSMKKNISGASASTSGRTSALSPLVNMLSKSYWVQGTLSAMKKILLVFALLPLHVSAASYLQTATNYAHSFPGCGGTEIRVVERIESFQVPDTVSPGATPNGQVASHMPNIITVISHLDVSDKSFAHSLRQTIAHECGHHLDDSLPSQPSMFEPFGSWPWISEYASTDNMEDFAETYADYVLHSGPWDATDYKYFPKFRAVRSAIMAYERLNPKSKPTPFTWKPEPPHRNPSWIYP